MSLRKSWPLRTGLTLGAAVLVFGLGSGPSIAAGHEGHAGHMAGMRGGGGGAGEVHSLNERFGSMRIETLSPVGGGFAHARPAPEVRQPTTDVHGVVRDPVLPSMDMSRPADDVRQPSASGPRVPTATHRPILEPRVIPNSVLTQLPNEPSAEARLPTTHVHGPVLDPVRPSLDAARPSPEATRPSLNAARPSLDASQPSAMVKQPTTAMQGAVLDPLRPQSEVKQPTMAVQGPVRDPLRPSPEVQRPSANTNHVILEEPWRQQNPPSPEAF